MGRRDRRLVVAIVAAAVVAFSAAAFVAETRDPQSSTGCVSYSEPGVMGGGSWHLCGAAAITFCRRSPARAVAACAELRRQQP